MSNPEYILTEPASSMDKFRVNWRISLFMSTERSLSPYNKSCIRALFEKLLICANGRNKFETPARRSRCKMSNDVVQLSFICTKLHDTCLVCQVFSQDY